MLIFVLSWLRGWSSGPDSIDTRHQFASIRSPENNSDASGGAEAGHGGGGDRRPRFAPQSAPALSLPARVAARV